MSDERTRTTKEVRDGYAYDSYSGDVDPYYELRFDRWLAAHDAEMRNAALEEAAGIARDFLRSDMVHGGPYWALRVAETIRAAKDGAQ